MSRREICGGLAIARAVEQALDDLRTCRLQRTQSLYIELGRSVHDATINYHMTCQAHDEALTHYWEVKKNHVELRKEYMKQLANDLADQNLTDQAVELKKKINIEKMR